MRVHRCPVFVCLAAAGADAVELRGAARLLDQTGWTDNALFVTTDHDYAGLLVTANNDYATAATATDPSGAAPPLLVAVQGDSSGSSGATGVYTSPSAPIVWGFEYVVEQRERDWNDHRQAAIAWGGQLASIRSAEEQAFVVSITDRDASYFLGGYKANDNWYWTDGTRWSYLHWAAGEPSNSNNIEDKLSLKKDGTWNDAVGAGGKQRGAVFKRPVRYPAAVPALFFGDQYRVEHNRRSWDEHARTAADWGGHLTSIRSAAEQEFVLDITDRDETYFLGGAQVDGIWTWTDGTPWSYAHWAVGEPSNSNNIEDKVSLKRDGTWNDAVGTGGAGGKQRGAVFKRRYSLAASPAPTTDVPVAAPVVAPVAPLQTPGLGVGIDIAAFPFDAAQTDTTQTPGPTSRGTEGACGACAGDECFFPAAGFCYNLAGMWWNKKITRIRGGAGCAEAYEDRTKLNGKLWRQCEESWIELLFNGKKVSDVSEVCCQP